MKKRLASTTLFFCLLMLLNLPTIFGQTKEWTMLVYVVGTDIVEDAITDLADMRAAGNTDNMNIVVLKGGAKIEGWEKPSTSIFVNGEEIPQSFLPSDDFIVSTTNLTEFINYGVASYPAEKYMLVFYNHGMATRGWGWANTSDTQFKINDLKAGIENSDFIQQGNKFEVLGFDACLMACLEAQSALQNVANYYIASEETEPWHAWNWTPVIASMNTESNLNGENLGRLITDTYIQHSIDKKTHHVTLSVVDLSKIDALEKSIENLLSNWEDDSFLANFLQARGKSEEYSKSISEPANSEDMVDIGDLFVQLKQIDPNLTPQIDDILEKLAAAVVYERSDNTRPLATGISMLVPMNRLTDDNILGFIINDIYKPIQFSETIKDFITFDYLSYALADNEPASGDIDNSLGLTAPSNGRSTGERYSALKVRADHIKELHQMQIILLEEIVGVPDEYLVLGSTHPDTVVEKSDGSAIYGYEWDEEWLSLNGIPAYVADIQDFEVKDSLGNVTNKFTRLHIPAILNANKDDERNILFSYVFDGNENYMLEGILRESYESEGGFLVTSKERIELKAGDEIHLIYEVFDTKTNESFFLSDSNAVINIQTGNSDLVLDHARLNSGKYHIGFVLLDHAHNDTIIYDPMVREIIVSSNEIIPVEEFGVSVYPNPVSNLVNVLFEKPTDAAISLFSANGQAVLNTEIQNGVTATMELEGLPAGVYFLKIAVEGKILQKELIKH